MEEALRCPLLWLVPLLELVPLVVSLGARTRARASPGVPRSPPSCRRMTNEEPQPLFPLPQKSLHPGHRASQMPLAPSDLSLPAQQEVGGGHFVVLLAGQGLFDFFPRVSHTHHHLWERGMERRFNLPRPFPSTRFCITQQCRFFGLFSIRSPFCQQQNISLEEHSFRAQITWLIPACAKPQGQLHNPGLTRVFHSQGHTDWLRIGR